MKKDMDASIQEGNNMMYLEGYRTFLSTNEFKFSFNEEISPAEYDGDMKYIHIDYKDELHKMNIRSLKSFQKLLETYRKSPSDQKLLKENSQQSREDLMKDIKSTFNNTLEILSAYRQEEIRFTLMERIKQQIEQKKSLINQLEETVDECETHLKNVEGFFN